MKCYPHNDYYRKNELDIVEKLLIACRLSSKDRQSIMTDAKQIQSKLTEEHYLTQIMK